MIFKTKTLRLLDDLPTLEQSKKNELACILIVQGKINDISDLANTELMATIERQLLNEFMLEQEIVDVTRF